jgi:hypothetical protein
METTPTTASEVAVVNTSAISKRGGFWRSPQWNILLIITITLLISGGYMLFHRTTKSSTMTETYTLVPEQVSESAAINVKLPVDITFATFNPKQSVHFSPEIKGQWEVRAEVPTDRVYRFLPETKLPVGAYYLATLDTPEIRMEKLFSVDKDPSVLAVFPKQDGEVNEFSNITIMFSRPMVALSTLNDMADIAPPVNIIPQTEGRWKWITTRTLQFIPTTRLVRSAHYKIEIAKGFSSTDGVAVPLFTREFTTRTLKYTYDGGYYSNSMNVPIIGHSEPIRIFFNQPIDLNKTSPHITLNNHSNTSVQFVAAYGTRNVRDEKTGKDKVLSDHSILEIYPKEDRNGRKFLWDFNDTYQLSLSDSVPSEGDIMHRRYHHRSRCAVATLTAFTTGDV